MAEDEIAMKDLSGHRVVDDDDDDDYRGGGGYHVGGYDFRGVGGYGGGYDGGYDDGLGDLDEEIEEFINTPTTSTGRETEHYVPIMRPTQWAEGNIERPQLSKNMNIALEKITEIFPNFDYSREEEIIVNINEDGEIVIKLTREGGVYHKLFDENSEINKKLPKKIKEILGEESSNIELRQNVLVFFDRLKESNQNNEGLKDKIKSYEDKLKISENKRIVGENIIKKMNESLAASNKRMDELKTKFENDTDTEVNKFNDLQDILKHNILLREQSEDKLKKKLVMDGKLKNRLKKWLMS